MWVCVVTSPSNNHVPSVLNNTRFLAMREGCPARWRFADEFRRKTSSFSWHSTNSNKTLIIHINQATMRTGKNRAFSAVLTVSANFSHHLPHSTPRGFDHPHAGNHAHTSRTRARACVSFCILLSLHTFAGVCTRQTLGVSRPFRAVDLI